MKTNNGLHIKFSTVNNAYFLMWFGTIIMICETRKDAEYEMNILSRREGEK